MNYNAFMLTTNPQVSSQVEPRASLHHWIAVSILGVGVMILLYGASRGIDLTDESFYITWISNPGQYKLLYQPFGLLLHPVFDAFGGSLTAIRIAGLVAVVVAGLFLGGALSHVYRIRWPEYSFRNMSLELLGAIAALAVYYQWVLTPNYNLLGNTGGMLLCASLILWWKGDSHNIWNISATFSAIIGSTFAFYGKPLLLIPFAFATGVLVLLAIRTKRWSVIVSASISALAALAFIALIASPYGSLGFLIERIFYSQSILVPQISLLSLPRKILTEIYTAPPILTTGIIGLCAGWFGASHVRNKRLEGFIISLVVMIIIFMSGKIGIAMIRGGEPAYLGLSLISILLLLAGLARLSGVSSESLIAPLVLAVIPFFVSIGSFNSINEQVSASAPFPLIGISMMLSLILNRTVRKSLEFGTGLLVLLLIINAAARPYGYGASVWSQQIEVGLGNLSGPRLVDPSRADSVRRLQTAASEAGFQVGAPVIDLSGTGAGTVPLIRGRQPILPWITSLTPDWADVVWSGMTNEERQNAWVIGPIHPNFTGTKIGKELKGLSARYENVGTVPMIFWGQEHELQLWRPLSQRETPSASVGRGQGSTFISDHRPAAR